MSKNIYFASDGAIMDEHDLAELRLIELALQNPRPGTPAAARLEQLAAESRKRDAERFPTATHSSTGALCFCQVRCEGGACRCWCHTGETP